ncbi:MAG: response regulator transcription factor [Sedimentisphaerales bacterium]|jgi:two-component system phosphate regulon response regulator PhoB|nr:response regulator transcription factor [Sedimentisphaerales bacterium]HNY77086.1 response regulator transcription factor [Sedimentisphaerales bacterium]HOC62498.1 response regulator transcription factor [Sedimentisphaerales bacterium]HOH63016.1 response regulator transcription factor [Sedimentisphaerales bacterium]HPY50569.1 response regulator transcription factor [Sedimentisphaerales bacterium]
MAKPTILVVDDEEDIRELVELNLRREGYHVLTCETGEQALHRAASKAPDVIVLDLMLPGIDGLEVCRRLKADPKTQQIAVVMLTAKGEEADIVTGLELGADDYVTKPFSGKVLVARVRRLLRTRRDEGDELAVVRIHDLTIDPSRHEVLVEDRAVSLTLTEFNILHTLAKRPGRVFTRYQIVDSIHGSDYLVTDRAVDVQIVSLRRKLGSGARYIETVRGVGYRFVDRSAVTNER